MNEHLRHPFPPPRKLATTQAADGYPRRAWTADEVQQMVEAGILDVHERLELIGGELVAMASKGILHERVKLALCEYWYDHRPKHLRIAPESALRLGHHDEPEPELFIFPATIEPEDVRGDAVLLVVEIADSSLVPDRTDKALRYARHDHEWRKDQVLQTLSKRIGCDLPIARTGRCTSAQEHRCRQQHTRNPRQVCLHCLPPLVEVELRPPAKYFAASRPSINLLPVYRRRC